MSSRILALVEHPATDHAIGQEVIEALPTRPALGDPARAVTTPTSRRDASHSDWPGRFVDLVVSPL